MTTRDLTSDEAERVDRLSKEEGSRPRIYDPNIGDTVEIPQDLEVYIILLSASQRRQIANFIKAIVDASDESVRDELARAWFDQERNNADSALNERADLVNNYESVRNSSRQAALGFERVEEINALWAVVNRALGFTFAQSRREQFSKSANRVLKARVNGLSDAQTLFLQTWRQALLAYS